VLLATKSLQNGPKYAASAPTAPQVRLTDNLGLFNAH
jgi:hypothetical protein